MENKNTIIAVVLMLVVWVGFSVLFPQQPPQPESSTTSGVKSVSTESAPPSSSAEPAPIPPQPLPIVPDSHDAVRNFTVESPLYRAVFSSRGGELIEYTLKGFQETTDPKSANVALVVPGPGNGTLLIGGREALSLPPGMNFHSDSPPSLHLDAEGKATLHFIGQTPSGAILEKIFVFHGNSYGIDLDVKVTNGGSNPLRGDLVLTLFHPWDPEQAGGQYDYVGPVSLVGDKVETAKIKDLAEKPQSFGADTVWTGFENKYFMNVGVPLAGTLEKVSVSKTSSGIENQLQTPYMILDPGTGRTFSYLLYFGPRDLDVLKGLDHQLAKAIDFGFFSIIATPLLHVLKFFYSFVGNYGIAIIALTVIIKLLFWPLTQKSYGSMKAMQKLQPEMQKIREKFKNDKERLNREMMELYKTHRVNPLGGCLPMLVQIPVFFALYKVLLSSIELRHAEFGFWLTDLSAKDPYYITPLIMGVTMFVQQKMSPSTMDPTQAKIFMLMPVVFTFLFLNFPSGLVIYWLVNNLLTILQQYFINRKPAA
ncbi:membrane protein insertase YidC [Desulfuromonas sp. DDH964]|uniref:membrane protein insertase YidC n=1 Tax=Desulfuromonas sp. DDH964 TaxID=1823759 RepID=UPI00078BA3B9|nr:membrane protein insertase YidC [Desulfuromonas sp. DDH964]AMV73973.1 preprotein translocase subunit YidC [Desulfuromonas sp. DDH964]